MFRQIISKCHDAASPPSSTWDLYPLPNNLSPEIASLSPAHLDPIAKPSLGWMRYTSFEDTGTHPNHWQESGDPFKYIIAA